jgi:hypothetical protein
MLLSSRDQKFKKLVFIPAITVLLVNYYINRSFYPQLLKYQSESEAAFFMQQHDIKEEQLVILGVREEMISYLQDRIVPLFSLEDFKPEDLSNQYVFTDQDGISKIKSFGLAYDTIQSFPDFRITVLNGTFFNKHTRDQAVEMKYLLKVSADNQ